MSSPSPLAEALPSGATLPERRGRTGELVPGPTWGRVLAVVGLSVVLAFVLQGTALDVRLFRDLNSWSRVTGGPPWACFSLLGEGTVLLGVVALLVARRPEFLWPFLFASLALLVTLHPAKDAFDVQRPLSVLGEEVIVIGKRLGKSSFPSGHTSVAFLAAHVLWCGLRRRGARVLVVVLAGACALSRCVVGAHWPSDVLGGLGLGWLAGALGVALAARVRVVEGRTTRVVLPLLFSCVSLVLALRRHEGYISVVRDAIAFVGLGLVLFVVAVNVRSARPGEV